MCIYIYIYICHIIEAIGGQQDAAARRHRRRAFLGLSEEFGLGLPLERRLREARPIPCRRTRLTPYVSHVRLGEHVSHVCPAVTRAK